MDHETKDGIVAYAFLLAAVIFSVIAYNIFFKGCAQGFWGNFPYYAASYFIGSILAFLIIMPFFVDNVDLVDPSICAKCGKRTPKAGKEKISRTREESTGIGWDNWGAVSIKEEADVTTYFCERCLNKWIHQTEWKFVSSTDIS